MATEACRRATLLALVGAVSAGSLALYAAWLQHQLRELRRALAVSLAQAPAEEDGEAEGEGRKEKDKGGKRRDNIQPVKDKAAERLKWWQQLNQVKPQLTLPSPRCPEALGSAPGLGDSAKKMHQTVVDVAEARLKRGNDWLVRDSDYGVAPAHAGVKGKVNAALVAAIAEITGDALPSLLAEDPKRIILLLDAPQFGTLSSIVERFPEMRYCQQAIVPQADLRHYFEMIRQADFYPGVRAQRLDHWLCANGGNGFRCVAAFLDYECRLVGAMSARLCPAADVMRYFRFGYPADLSILAITVGLEAPAERPEDVDAFVRTEATLNGYVAELRETWKYRMVTLLYVVRRADVASGCLSPR